MPTILGSLRRLVLAPKLVEVGFKARGFSVAPTEATQRLEAIPQSVVCGFEWGIDTRDQWELERRSHRARDLLRGPGARHLFLAYIGIGFAMSHLPRSLWRSVVPDLTGSPYHPTMSWLAVDGYGFDRAYFDTRRWVTAQERPLPYPWDGRPDYFPRAFDQGIGRALWFIHGGQTDDVASAVNGFASTRHADLWSGVGLAATFAGGFAPESLAGLRRAAGPHQAHLAQGSVFAAKARDFSGCVPPHTDVAVSALCDLTVAAASTLADDATQSGHQAGRLPSYEAWRQRIRARVSPATVSDTGNR
jgi:hypothetical protein